MLSALSRYELQNMKNVISHNQLNSELENPKCHDKDGRCPHSMLLTLPLPFFVLSIEALGA